MNNRPKMLVRFCILGALIASYKLLPNTTASQPNEIQLPREIPVVVTQIEQRGVSLPLEVRCKRAQLNEANQLVGFSCTLTNKSSKNIRGVALTYSIIEALNGETVKDTHSWVLDCLIHPDFEKTHKPIRPAGENEINSGKISFGDAVPKSIEISVDYVEFEDGATMGPNVTGSQIIGEMRDGAIKYKEWLSREYAKRGKSENSMVALIQDNKLPDELKELESNSNEGEGARAYRILLRKMLNANGITEVKKHFPQ